MVSWRLENVAGDEARKVFSLSDDPDTSDDGVFTFACHFKIDLVFLPVRIAFSG